MDTADLTRDERLALVGLAKVLVRADRQTSDAEYAALDAMGARLGEGFAELLELARERFRSRADVMAHAATIERQEARNLVYRELYALAVADEIASSEALFLHEIAALWAIAEQPV